MAAGVAARFHPSPGSRTDRAREIVIAGLRAAAQPALVSLVINWAVNNLAALLALLLMMFAGAVRTAGRRITGNHTWWLTAAPIAASVVPVVAALLLTGLVPLKGIAPIPITGILVGGALTVRNRWSAHSRTP